jgi:acyl carrier protein|tara:strand:- start:14 stop:277 length:264 start_codon:yes stop_codon:yes gene_type:complete
MLHRSEINKIMNLSDIIKKNFKLSADTEINDEHGPGDLDGWDSLGHVILINAIQKEYSILIDMDEMIEIESILDIRKLLETKGVSAF